MRYRMLLETLSPSSVDSEFQYENAHLFQILGNREKADYWYERGREVDQITPRVHIRWARMLAVYGEFDELRNHLSVAYSKNFIDEDQVPSFVLEVLAILRIISGDYDGGIALAEKIVNIESPVETLSNVTNESTDLLQAMAYGYRMTGQDRKAGEMLDYAQKVLEAKEQEGKASPAVLGQKALNLAMLGRLSQAGDVLAAAVDAGWRNYRLVMHDPRWQELLDLPALDPLLAFVTADLDRQAIEIEAILAEQNY